MATIIPSPVAQWAESPASGAALPIARLYWHRDTVSDTWSLTTDARMESGALADLGTGTYAFVATALIPFSAPRLKVARLNGTTTRIY